MRTRISLLSCLALLAATAAANAVRWDLPDPRYRGPIELWEVQAVAWKVASASGFPISGYMEIGKNEQAPLLEVRGPSTNNTLVLNPHAVRVVPPNSWAFIFGHMFAHQVDAGSRGRHGKTSPKVEQRADLVGATFARAAGFDLGAHLAWALGTCNQGACVDDASTDRVMALAKHFRISRWTIERHRRLMGWAPWFKR